MLSKAEILSLFLRAGYEVAPENVTIEKSYLEFQDELKDIVYKVDQETFSDTICLEGTDVAYHFNEKYGIRCMAVWEFSSDGKALGFYGFKNLKITAYAGVSEREIEDLIERIPPAFYQLEKMDKKKETKSYEEDLGAAV